MQTSYDVIVAGGGPSGVMAAIASARLGAKTLLIERHGFLGGMNTAALVGPIMTFYAGKLQIIRGIAGEIFDELKDRGGTPGHLVDPIWGNTSMTPIDTEIYKPLLLEKVRESGCDLLLHTVVMDGVADAPRGASSKTVLQVRVMTKGGVENLKAKFFIDASGDGDLASRLGCAFQMGREKDQLTQPMTLMFKMRGVDPKPIRDAIRKDPGNFYLGLPLEEYLDVPCLAVAGFFKEVQEGKKRGDFPFDRDRVLFFGGIHSDEVLMNTLRISRVDGTSSEDLTRAESELRVQVHTLADFLRTSIPGFEHAYVTETAAQIGVRETRHIDGEYTLKAQDILNQTQFEDTIAHASYPIDIHSPDGSAMKIVDPRKNNPESFYDIPYRCLIPKGFSNLLVTGRCISAEHEASASSRISATCMALGQAAGTAAALLKADQKKDFRDLSAAKLRERLLEDGAFLRS